MTAAANGIVHIGVGNFFRAHQAVYLDALLADDTNAGWGICGVGMLEPDRAIRDGLQAQGFSYSLVLKHPDGRRERQEIHALRQMLLAPEDPWAVVERLADPATRIVTLTITEGGYNINDLTGDFDTEAPAVRADAERGAAPRTVFGVVAHALDRRRKAGEVPFTVVSCDNLEANGHLARGAFIAFARMLDAELAEWVEAHVAFPNSMVDRITPMTTEADRAMVRADFGVEDLVPVTCEPFMQWVLEDHFTAGRPPLENVGVQLVEDVRPYELMKLRLLNAGHQALAYYGLLLGLTHVHDAAQDPDLRSFTRRYMDEESTPTLSPVPGVDLDLYKATLIERFSNPEIADTLARLAAFSTDRIPKWVVPVIGENRRNGGQVTLAAGIVASWLRYTELMPEQVVDRRSVGRSIASLLADRELFGDLVEDEAFLSAVEVALTDLRELDARAALRKLLA